MLKPYIEFKTQVRTEAEKNENEYQKLLCKLMNNGGYGKTMENLRNTIDVRFASNEKDYSKWESKLVICHKKDLTAIWLQFVKTKLC